MADKATIEAVLRSSGPLRARELVQAVIGTNGTNGSGTMTDGELRAAIWELIDEGRIVLASGSRLAVPTSQ